VPPIPRPPDPIPIKANTPTPTNGNTNVDPSSVTLSWTDGGNSTSYNVFLNGAPLGNQLIPSLALGAISIGNYTWRVDSVNTFGTTTGDTWTFIANGPAFENFEIYTNTSPLNGLNGGTGWGAAWISS
jgi:hypothetical protein